MPPKPPAKPPAPRRLQAAPVPRPPLWERAVQAFHGRMFAPASRQEYMSGLDEYGDEKPGRRDYHLITLVFRGVQGLADCAASLRSIDATLKRELPALRRKIDDLTDVVEDSMAGEGGREPDEEEEEEEEEESDGDEDGEEPDDDAVEGDDDGEQDLADVERQMAEEYEQQQSSRAPAPKPEPEPAAITPDAILPAPATPAKPARNRKPKPAEGEGGEA